MAFVILKIILLLAILISPLFFYLGKRRKQPLDKPKEDEGLSNYGINEDGYLEEIKKREKL